MAVPHPYKSCVALAPVHTQNTRPPVRDEVAGLVPMMNPFLSRPPVDAAMDAP
jgi:hypothetical protein